jgi:signal transduction histidine kinase
MLDAASSSRRLLLLWMVTTVVPVVCLLWLAWLVAKDDKHRNPNPVRDRRERAAEAGVNALQQLFTQLEGHLGSVDESFGDYWGVGHVDGLSLAVMRRNPIRLRDRAPFSFKGARPLYLPVKYPNLYELELYSRSEYAAVLDEADRKEFRERDLAGALKLLKGLSVDSRRQARADAQLRIARIELKLGHRQEALEAYGALSAMRDTNVAEWLPATLLAAKGRAIIYAETDRQDELRQVASEIYDGLINRRWMLGRGDFQHAYRQAADWLAGERAPIDAEQLAIAEALNMVWQSGINDDRWRKAGIDRTRRTIRVDGVAVLAVTEWSPGGLRAVFVAPRYLQQAWRKVLMSKSEHDGVDFVLADTEGRPVLGALAGAPSRWSMRSGAAMQLPWTVYAISAADDSVLDLSLQAKAVLSGIALMGLVVVAGAYVINRAMLRELRVARMQSEFVAAVSHEFRTPLTTLRQLAEMLVKGRVSSDERRLMFYDQMLRESERMQRMVEGLLNFGSMEAGELQYRFTTIECDSFVRDIVADFEKSIEGRGYRVEMTSSGQVPLIRADGELLARVFWNLLDNAVKYSPDHNDIRVEVHGEDAGVAVSVHDHGAGIAASEQQTIFHKFVRGEAAKTASVQGTGVGLAMARQIVTAHGGRISVESQPGQGSVFTVWLPAAPS